MCYSVGRAYSFLLQSAEEGSHTTHSFSDMLNNEMFVLVLTFNSEDVATLKTLAIHIAFHKGKCSFA